MQNQKSALGMDGNVTALIGYLIGIVALVLIFIEKDNKFVRFHALQSVLWGVGLGVVIFVVAIVGSIIGMVLGAAIGAVGWIISGLVWLICAVLFLALFGGLIYGAIKSFGGEMVKLPFVGNMAEKWV